MASMATGSTVTFGGNGHRASKRKPLEIEQRLGEECTACR
jgi:hypothetical protein